jgi:hypothetical protein
MLWKITLSPEISSNIGARVVKCAKLKKYTQTAWHASGDARKHSWWFCVLVSKKESKVPVLNNGCNPV